MSNEIKLSGYLGISKAGLVFDRRTGTSLFDQTGDGITHATQNVGDVAEALDVGNVTDIGPFLFLNLSTLYSVKVGLDASGATWFLDLPPESFACGNGLDCNAPYALASDSTGVELEYFLVQR